jgi:hypothetical protein
VSPINITGEHVDLSTRFVQSTTVVASPTGGTEVIIASVTIPAAIIVTGVDVYGWAAFTVGTNGVSGNLKIRQTSVSGSTIAATGATTQTATDLGELDVAGFDPSPAQPPTQQLYKLTLLIGSGSATSTVSAVYLKAVVY